MPVMIARRNRSPGQVCDHMPDTITLPKYVCRVKYGGHGM